MKQYVQRLSRYISGTISKIPDTNTEWQCIKSWKRKNCTRDQKAKYQTSFK